MVLSVWITDCMQCESKKVLLSARFPRESERSHPDGEFLNKTGQNQRLVLFFPQSWEQLSMELFVIWDWLSKQVTLLWFSSFPATTRDYEQLKIQESVFSSITFTDKISLVAMGLLKSWNETINKQTIASFLTQEKLFWYCCIFH